MTSCVYDTMEFGYCEVEDMLSCSNKSNDGAERVISQRAAHFCVPEDGEDSGDFDPSADFELCESSTFEEACLFSKYQQQEEQLQAISDHGLLDGIRYDIATPPLQTSLEEIAEFNKASTKLQGVNAEAKRKPISISLASLEILNQYRSGLKWMREENTNSFGNHSRDSLGVDNLSTVDTMRIASAKFIQSHSSAEVDDHLWVPSCHYDSYFSGYPKEPMRNVQLAETLFAAAEKVGTRRFDAAIKFLDQCDSLSSSSGNPVERLVYYFSGALREKIDRETGTVSEKGLGKRPTLDIDAVIMKPSPPIISIHQQIPFFQLQQFCAIQTIVEQVAKAKKVHVIDLGIRYGTQWVVLMQALVARQECPVELLKITAIGTFLPELIEETGRRLELFANNLNLQFSFNIIMLSDMIDLKEDLIEVEEEETVVVFAQFLLRTMIPQPDRLESVMAVFKKMDPCMMVVAEFDSNLNSPAFVTRFIDALFYYSAFFDCFEECMKHDEENRKFTESMLFMKAIRTIIAAEGEERTERHMKLSVWRAFFNRYEMVEVDLGFASLRQAVLVKDSLPCAKSCTLEMNGKSLTIGWKGTPICFLSAWKFR